MVEKDSCAVCKFATKVAQFTWVPNHVDNRVFHPKTVNVVAKLCPLDRVVLTSGASENLDDLVRSTKLSFNFRTDINLKSDTISKTYWF